MNPRCPCRHSCSPSNRTRPLCDPSALFIILTVSIKFLFVDYYFLSRIPSFRDISRRDDRGETRPRTRTVGGGFEPPVPFRVLRFSRPVQSSTLPSHRSVAGQADIFVHPRPAGSSQPDGLASLISSLQDMPPLHNITLS